MWNNPNASTLGQAFQATEDPSHTIFQQSVMLFFPNSLLFPVQMIG